MEPVARIVGSLAVLVSAGITTAGITTAGVVVEPAQEPEPTTVASLRDDCPAPRAGWYDPAEPVPEREELQDTAAAARRYAAAHDYHFRRIAVCPDSGTVLVYRASRHPEVDDVLRTAVRLAAPADVGVRFVDVPLPARAAAALLAEARPFMIPLKQRGILTLGVYLGLADAWVTVSVADNVRGARDVLAPLGDRVRVVRGERTCPGFEATCPLDGFRVVRPRA